LLSNGSVVLDKMPDLASNMAITGIIGFHWLNLKNNLPKTTPNWSKSNYKTDDNIK
jgi:hypothetical protein